MNRENKKSLGKILIADDEQTFLRATAQLLRNKGFECDCAGDGQQTLDKLSKKNYDLLIADIKMPGNTNLELVRNLSQSAPQLSIIIVTAYPSQQTAIDTIHLPVIAYLVKPVDLADLLLKTRAGVKISRLYKTVAATRESLQQWISELETTECALRNNKCNIFETTLKGFLDTTTLKIDEVFNAISQITDLLDDLRPQTQICQVMQCPTLSELAKGLQESIMSLKESKELYKSKQLGNIRVKLEKILKRLQTN